MTSNLGVKEKVVPEIYTPKCYSTNRPPSRQGSRPSSRQNNRCPSSNNNGHSKSNEKKDCPSVYWPNCELNSETSKYLCECRTRKSNDDYPHRNKEKQNRCYSANGQKGEQRMKWILDDSYGVERPQTYCCNRPKPDYKKRKHHEKKKEYVCYTEVHKPNVCPSNQGQNKHNHDLEKSNYKEFVPIKCEQEHRPQSDSSYKPETDGRQVICIYPPKDPEFPTRYSYRKSKPSYNEKQDKNEEEKLCNLLEVIFPYKTRTKINKSVKTRTKVDEKICDGLMHVKSVSVVGGVLRKDCACEKRNGLQDYCKQYHSSQRQECSSYDKSQPQCEV